MTQLAVTKEELEVLDAILQRELDSSYGELRRTSNVEFRQQIRHRRELTEHILQQIHEAESAATA